MDSKENVTVKAEKEVSFTLPANAHFVQVADGAMKRTDMSHCPDEPTAVVSEDIMFGDRKIGERTFAIRAATAECAIKEHMAQDASYAAFWHTHLAKCILETGASHVAANEAASRIMKQFFGVDVKAK